ncbi:MAG TPA: DUF6600 domain-containing protein [Stellaceae bacterium]|nr:DUF6600 domain-containing protein [Stellaceae bacterium]
MRLLFSTIIGAVALSTAGCADDNAASRIGRVSAVVGAVQYDPDGGDWTDALVNEPVAAGTGLRSRRAGQAELRIAGDRVALADDSELRLLRLDRDTLQIALSQGRIGVHLDKAGGSRTVEIDLPQGGVWLTAPGDYDIAAGEAQSPPRIAVLTGNALVGGGLSDSSIVAASVVAPAADSFSEWWRGQSEGDVAASSRHVSPAIAGVEALAANGTWESDATFGDVWYPKDLADDWAPYRYGSWRFLPPWGWTWIDDAAWGFAPSHYGRWARIDARWAWVPGPQGDHPAYSPAAVAFLGTAGVGLSRPGEVGPAVAWFPLAPGEVAEDPDAHYRNRLFSSIVPRTVFKAGKPVKPELIQLPDQRLEDAPVILGALRIAPAAAGALAAAPIKPAAVKPAVVKTAAHVAAAAPPAAKAPPPTRVQARKVFLAHARKAPVQAAQKKRAIAAAPRRSHIAAASSPRAQPAPSTPSLHSAHNRPHLAATRGEAPE